MMTSNIGAEFLVTAATVDGEIDPETRERVMAELRASPRRPRRDAGAEPKARRLIAERGYGPVCGRFRAYGDVMGTVTS